MQKPKDKATSNGFRFPEIRGRTGEYLLCIMFHFMFPLLPIAAEASIQGGVATKSWLLFLSVYLPGIGVASRSRFLFGVAVVAGLFYATIFGASAAHLAVPQPFYWIGHLLTLIVVTGLLSERYNRHIAEEELFFDFT